MPFSPSFNPAACFVNNSFQPCFLSISGLEERENRPDDDRRSSWLWKFHFSKYFDDFYNETDYISFCIVAGKIVVVLDRKEGPWHRCMRIRPVSRLAAGSLRVITELHGRMDDVTKLQRDRQPAILPWKARERDASPGCIVIGQDRSSRESESLQIEIGEEYFIARS